MMRKAKVEKRFWVIFTLGLLSVIGPISIDMYLPSFPTMAKSMHTSVAHISMSLSSFFIGISVGQMLYGPLLDRFGRKIPLYFGLFLYLATSVLCAFTQSADALIFTRFLQALGSCVGMVAARALVRDIFPVNENAKIFSALMLVIAISPMLAPTAGGYLSSTFGWHSVFVVMAIVAVLIIIAVYVWLPNGAAPDKNKSLLPRPIIKSFWAVAINRQFFIYTLAGSLAASGLYSYIAGSPFVFMKLYHVTEQHYGWIFAFIAMGLLVASQLNNLLLRKYSSEFICKIALGIQSLVGLVLIAGAYFNFLSLYSTIGLIWLFLGMQGFAFPNTSALAIAPFSKNAGTASALMGAIQLGIGSLATVMVNILANQTDLPMAGVMSSCALLSFIVILVGEQKRRVAER